MDAWLKGLGRVCTLRIFAPWFDTLLSYDSSLVFTVCKDFLFLSLHPTVFCFIFTEDEKMESDQGGDEHRQKNEPKKMIQDLSQISGEHTGD